MREEKLALTVPTRLHRRSQTADHSTSQPPADPENAKNEPPDPATGPTPATTSSVSERVLPSLVGGHIGAR